MGLAFVYQRLREEAVLAPATRRQKWGSPQMLPARGGASDTRTRSLGGCPADWAVGFSTGRLSARSDAHPGPLPDFLGRTLGNRAREWVLLPRAPRVICLGENVSWPSVQTGQEAAWRAGGGE